MLETSFFLAKANLNFSEEAVVHINDAAPLHTVRVYIQACEATAFFLCQFVRIGFVNAELLEAAQHGWREFAIALLIKWAESVEEFLIILLGLVHHTRIECRGAQVMCGGNGMDIARQVQVEIFHRDDLRIATTGRAALDAERRSL